MHGFALCTATLALADTVKLGVFRYVFLTSITKLYNLLHGLYESAATPVHAMRICCNSGIKIYIDPGVQMPRPPKSAHFTLLAIVLVVALVTAMTFTMGCSSSS